MKFYSLKSLGYNYDTYICITGWAVGSSQALELKFFSVPSYLFV